MYLPLTLVKVISRSQSICFKARQLPLSSPWKTGKCIVMRLDIHDSSHNRVCCHTGMSYGFFFPFSLTFDIWYWTGMLCYEFDKYMGQYQWAIQLFRFLLENREDEEEAAALIKFYNLYVLKSSTFSHWFFSFCVAMYLEWYQIKMTWMATKLLLLVMVMTLRMNLKLLEDNAPKSVPTLIANDHVHMRYNSCTSY